MVLSRPQKGLRRQAVEMEQKEGWMATLVAVPKTSKLVVVHSSL